MITIERFSEIVEEELKALPEYVFEELNGGVIVDEKVNLHPKRLADDLYIMGTYSTSPIMGKQIALFYGSFAATMGGADEERIRLKIRDTLRHEFRHHMETRAGFFGDGTLIDEDKRDMERYYLMHKKREETREARVSEVNVSPAGEYSVSDGESVNELSDREPSPVWLTKKNQTENRPLSGVLPAGFEGVRFVSRE